MIMAKKSILAGIITALLMTGAAHAAEIYNKDGNKLDFYGKAVGEHQFITSGKTTNSDSSYARIGFKGQTQINDILSGYGQWEYNMDASHPEEVGQVSKTRLAFAGVKAGEYGSFDYGRNFGAIYDVEAYTDMLVEWGGDAWSNTDNFTVQRANGLATYRNHDFFGLVDGLNFALQYQGKNDNGYKTSNGDGVSLSSTYDIGAGLSVAVGYSTADRASIQTKDNIGNRADAWAVSTKYDANNIYAAVLYAETHNMTLVSDTEFANKTQNIEAVTQYQFDFGLRPSVAYVQSKGEDLGANHHISADLKKYIEVGTWYYFNKNMNVYAAYQFNLLNDENTYAGKATDNLAAAGIVYQF